MAEQLQRPLYKVRAGDLGVSAKTVESSLKEALDRCSHWNAVLLIDEADVFLERRSNDNLERNQLVSSKSPGISRGVNDILTVHFSILGVVGVLRRRLDFDNQPNR